MPKNSEEKIEKIYQAALSKNATVLTPVINEITEEECQRVREITYSENLQTARSWVGTDYIRKALIRLISEDKIEEVDFVIFNINDEYLAGYGGSGFLGSVASCAAKNGYRDYCEKWRLHKNADVSSIASGAILAKDWEYFERLLLIGVNLHYIISDLAEQGHFDHLETLLSENQHDESKLLNWAGHGAAEGGYLKKAEEFIQRGADVSFVLRGAANSGYVSFIEKYITNPVVDINDILDALLCSQSEASKNYMSELQIRLLMDNPNRAQFRSMQNIADWCMTQIPALGSLPSRFRMGDDTLQKAVKCIAHKERYQFSGNKELISIIHLSNEAAFLLLIAMLTNGNPSIYKLRLPFELYPVIFSYIFGCSDTVIARARLGRNESSAIEPGFGLFCHAVAEKVKNVRMVYEERKSADAVCKL